MGGIARGDITLTFQGFIASEDITGLGIDLAALSVLLFLFRKESAARAIRYPAGWRQPGFGVSFPLDVEYAGTDWWW